MQRQFALLHKMKVSWDFEITIQSTDLPSSEKMWETQKEISNSNDWTYDDTCMRRS